MYHNLVPFRVAGIFALSAISMAPASWMRSAGRAGARPLKWLIKQRYQQHEKGPDYTYHFTTIYEHLPRLERGNLKIGQISGQKFKRHGRWTVLSRAQNVGTQKFK
jgi:hypothetical protein